MSSEVLSEQSYACEGAGYDKVYPLGQYDLSALYPERDLYANSPSEEKMRIRMRTGLKVIWMKFQATRRATRPRSKPLSAPMALRTSSSP